MVSLMSLNDVDFDAIHLIEMRQLPPYKRDIIVERKR